MIQDKYLIAQIFKFNFFKSKNVLLLKNELLFILVVRQNITNKNITDKISQKKNITGQNITFFYI